MIAPPLSPPSKPPNSNCGNRIKDTDNYIWTCEKSIHTVDEYDEKTWHKDRTRLIGKNGNHQHIVLIWCGNEERGTQLW